MDVVGPPSPPGLGERVGVRGASCQYYFGTINKGMKHGK
jgi:hypothetical protein